MNVALCLCAFVFFITKTLSHKDTKNEAYTLRV